ncbi:glycosyltransferase family 25 protein [Mesorhizobium sp. M0203]|uniref:glycosyltransferase family 25 protein n=1 Tax=Mesorhizobium sp. M0203 TaxID=2956912 RepID=UPI003335D67A
MRIFIISLDRSSDRRLLMQDQLNPFGLPYEFFRAVDGHAGEHLSFLNYRDEFCVEAWHRPLTAGEVGCFASHYQLWRQCVERDEPIVVMEDDVEVASRFPEALAIASRRPGGVGYIRLAATTVFGYRSVNVPVPPGWDMVRFLKGPWGTQCYVLFPDAASRLLAKSKKWILPVDNYMDSSWRHNLAAVGLMPLPVVNRRDSRSEISLGGPTPSTVMRGRVSRPKRYIARQLSDLRRILKNVQYALSD